MSVQMEDWVKMPENRLLSIDENPGAVRLAVEQIFTNLAMEASMEKKEPINGLFRFLQYFREGERKILSEKDLEYLREFLPDVIEERHERADEIESREIAEAAEIANRYFTITPYAIMCIDGRVTITNRWGMFAGMKAGSMQMPAGDSHNDFLRGKDGTLFLDPKSHIADLISTSLEKDDTIVELLDSHLGCAARKQEQESLGNGLKDDGLLADVKRKKEMSQAMKKYADTKSGKKIMPIQGSFDPHSGFAYVGLESEAALRYAEEHGGFSQDVLDQLSDEGKIISTKSLVEEFMADFEEAWDSFEPKLSWKKRYKKTALQMWQKIEEMAPKFLPGIKEKMKKVYGLDEGEELDMRARLLFSSAFNSFCNVHVSEFNPDGKYLSAQHKESFVSVTPRDFRPFANHMSFGVYDADLRNLARSVGFASAIVRVNRTAGRVEKPDQYETAQKFASAPVAAVVKEIFREKGVKWEKFEQLDWSFLEQIDWMNIDGMGLLGKLQLFNPGANIGIHLGQAIINLRDKMRALYDTAGDTSSLLVEGRIVPLPVICDGSRRFRILIPFVKKGFEMPKAA